MKVIKRNGNVEDCSFDKISERIKKLAGDKQLGLLSTIDPQLIAKKVISSVYDNITTKELDLTSAKISAALGSDNPEYLYLASRIIVSNHHKNTPKKFSEYITLSTKNINANNEISPLINKELTDIVLKNPVFFDELVEDKRDYLFDFFGFSTLEKTYLLKATLEKGKKVVIERPQYMYLRICLGLYKNDLEKIKEHYTLMSNQYYTHASPTLFNAGTKLGGLSSCYLLGIEDSIEGIYKCLTDSALISKNAGGIGVHVSNIRGDGSYIKGTNGISDGIIPMIKMFEATANYCNQGSRRKGSIAIYLEPHHSDIFEFLELRKNVGDEKLRARDLFYGMWVSDYFMKQVEEDKLWYLMTPDVSKNLENVYGEEYVNLYQEYVNDKKYVKSVKARDLWNKIIVSQIETGLPYMCYKDHVNHKSNQKNYGIVKSSNLCVSGDTNILTQKGYYKIKDLEGQNISVWNGECFSETQVVKTGENQDLIKIVFSNGMVLKTTKYHKFFITEKNEELQVEARELRRQDVIHFYELPVIDSGVELLDAFNKGKRQQDPPINFTIQSKIRWLNGFYYVNGFLIKEKDRKTIENVAIYSSTEEFTTKVCYLLNTLGVNPEMKKVFESYIIYINTKDFYRLYTYYGFINEYVNKQEIVKESEENVKVKVLSIDKVEKQEDTFCFNEPLRHRGIFNGILTGNCTEIMLYSDSKETAVCNIATMNLPKYIEKDSQGNASYNYKKLYEITKKVVLSMNKVIDHNVYPTKESKYSNFKHRPISIGGQGLANVFFLMKTSFESEEGKKINKNIYETIQFASIEASMELSKKEGPYETFEGSPSSKGIFQHNMWNVSNNELSGMFDWEKLKEDVIKYGLRNSMLTSSPPTASTSQILGNYESFEPITNNIFTRETLSGTFMIINKYLIEDLQKIGLWNRRMKEKIIVDNGSIQNIKEIPENLKEIYKTVWEVSQKKIMELSKDRALFSDHSQSLNLYIKDPSVSKISSAHFYAWKLGLKTGMYYLRTRSKALPQKFSISPESQVCNLEDKSCMSCSG